MVSYVAKHTKSITKSAQARKIHISNRMPVLICSFELRICSNFAKRVRMVESDDDVSDSGYFGTPLQVVLQWINWLSKSSGRYLSLINFGPEGVTLFFSASLHGFEFSCDVCLFSV